MRNASSSSKDKQSQQIEEESKKPPTTTNNNNKQPKNKWVPLEINLSKNKSNKNRLNRPPTDGQSTVSEGDKDWRAEFNDHSRNGRHSRSSSAAPRGRGIRNRGALRAPSHRSINRDHSDSVFNETTDFYVSFLLLNGVPTKSKELVG